MEPNGPENDLNVDELDPDFLVAYYMVQTLEALEAAKPNDRSSRDRRYAITIIELEKVRAFFDFYVMRGDDEGAAPDYLWDEGI